MFNGCATNKFEKTVEIASANYSEYLDVKLVVDCRMNGAMFHFGSIPGCTLKMYSNAPKIVVKITPKDDSIIFEKTSVSLQTQYVFKQWNIASGGINYYIGWDDMSISTVSVNIDENGCGETVVVSTSDRYQPYVCGAYGAFVKEISGTAKIPCVHNYIDVEVISEAKCTENGEIKQVCTKCEKNRIKTINALEHEFVNYISNNDATETQDGTKTAKCEREGCSVTDTKMDEGSKLSTNQ